MKITFSKLRALVGALSFYQIIGAMVYSGAVVAGSLTPGSQVVTGSAIGQVTQAQPTSTNMLLSTVQPYTSGGTAVWTKTGSLTLNPFLGGQWDAGFFPSTIQGTGTADTMSTTTPSGAFASPAAASYTFSGQFSTSANFQGITSPTTQSKVSVTFSLNGGAPTQTATVTFNPTNGQILGTTGNVTGLNIQLFTTQVFTAAGINTNTPILGMSFTVGSVAATTNRAVVTITPQNITGGGTKQLVGGAFQLEAGAQANAFIPTGIYATRPALTGKIPYQTIPLESPAVVLPAGGTSLNATTDNNITYIANTAGGTFDLATTPSYPASVPNGTTFTLVNNNTGQTTILATSGVPIVGPGIAAAGVASLAFPPTSGTAYPGASITLRYDEPNTKWRVVATNLGTVAGGIPSTSNCVFTATGLNDCPIGATTASTGAFTTINASGAITPSQTAGIVGTTTNNSADAGSVGEFITSTVAPTTTGLTTGTAANVTSISLTAGDWDVFGNFTVDYGAGTPVLKLVKGSISTTSATHGAVSNSAVVAWDSTIGINPATSPVIALPVVRLLLNATTTVYLVETASFSGVTFGPGGTLSARRRR